MTIAILSCAVRARALRAGFVGALTVVAGAATSAATVLASELKGHGGPVRAVAPLGDGIVTGGFDSAIIEWSITPALARRVRQHHDSTVNALVPLPGSCFASGGEDGRLALWCGTESAPRHVVAAHSAPIAALAVAPDGRHLASAGWDHAVRLWTLSDGLATTPREIGGHAGPVNGVAFTGDGAALVSAGYDGQLRLTPLDGGPALSVMLGLPVNAVAVLPSGEIAAAGADGKVRFLDRRLGPLDEMEIGHGPLTTLALAPDARLMATAGLRTPVTIIDVAARKVAGEILGPGLPIWSLAFSANGRELLTGGADRAVRRFDPVTGKPVGEDIAKAVEDDTANDPHPGARVFRACKACHGLGPDDTNRAGPTLYGVMGRRVGTLPGYGYSEALRTRDIEWSKETIARLFEVGPNAYLPGTKMPEQTIGNAEERRALVEWLASKTAPRE